MWTDGWMNDKQMENLNQVQSQFLTGRSGAGVVGNMQDYQSRDHKIDSPDETLNRGPVSV